MPSSEAEAHHNELLAIWEQRLLGILDSKQDALDAVIGIQTLFVELLAAYRDVGLKYGHVSHALERALADRDAAAQNAREYKKALTEEMFRE